MPHQLSQHGICKSCAFGSICQLHRKADVIQCDQFVSQRQTHHHFKPSKVNLHPHTHPGLCDMCVFEKACTLTVPAGGAWECEQYENAG